MQLDLEACIEEINGMFRCHNCEALNCPQEERPARPLPIPPDYIDNLQSRLIKVKKRILPSTLKITIKTHYHLPAAPITSPTEQPDDRMGGHPDGENSPQERPRASEEEEKNVPNGTPSTDEGRGFNSHTEVGTDNEATQLADRHFEWASFWQHQGTTAKSTDLGRDNPIQADFAGNHETVTATRVAVREEAAIGRHRQGTASTDKNKQYDPGGTGTELFIFAKWPCCILHALLCVFFSVLPSLQFPMLSYQVLKATRSIHRCERLGYTNQRSSFT